MKKPIVSLIVAVGENREMGKDNDLPWGRALPTDQKRFREKTKGHAVISGRRTFESMGGKAWPNRTNIVVTKDPDWIKNRMKEDPNLIVCNSIIDAIEEAKKYEKEEVFIIGGGQVFAAAMPYTDKIYLTFIHAKFPDADTFFPDYSQFKKVVYREEVSENGYDYEFIDLVR